MSKGENDFPRMLHRLLDLISEVSEVSFGTSGSEEDKMAREESRLEGVGGVVPDEELAVGMIPSKLMNMFADGRLSLRIMRRRRPGAG